MTDTYIVKENDTINSIASKFNTSPEIIELLNKDIIIEPGINLIIPKINNKYFDYYVVINGDTIFMGDNEYFLIK